MRSADVDGEVDGLTGLVGVDVVRVVGVLVTLAEPDVTGVGVVVALTRGDLQFTLNVAVVVGLLVVVDLLATSLLHGATGHTSLGGGDETVTLSQGDEPGEGEDGTSLLHFGGLKEDCFSRREKKR